MVFNPELSSETLALELLNVTKPLRFCSLSRGCENCMSRYLSSFPNILADKTLNPSFAGIFTSRSSHFEKLVLPGLNLTVRLCSLSVLSSPEMLNDNLQFFAVTSLPTASFPPFHTNSINDAGSSQLMSSLNARVPDTVACPLSDSVMTMDGSSKYASFRAVVKLNLNVLCALSVFTTSPRLNVPLYVLPGFSSPSSGMNSIR